MSLSEKLEKVHRELPNWIAEAAVAKCGVDKRSTMVSKLLQYVVEPKVKKDFEKLQAGEKILIDFEPVIEAAMRGWKDLPIRPLARKEMEFAMDSMSGSRLSAGLSIKLYSVAKGDKKHLVIEILESAPPPPPGPKRVCAVVISDSGNVIISLRLLEKEKFRKTVKTIDMLIEKENTCSLNVANATLADFEWLFGEDPINAAVRRLSLVAAEVKSATVRIEFLTPASPEEVEKLLMEAGISKNGFQLVAA